LAQWLAKKYAVHDFLKILKGMNGDHTSVEKGMAMGVKDIKMEAAIQDLGTGREMVRGVGPLFSSLECEEDCRGRRGGGMEGIVTSMSGTQQESYGRNCGSPGKRCL
jgi:hypothetical protein